MMMNPLAHAGAPHHPPPCTDRISPSPHTFKALFCLCVLPSLQLGVDSLSLLFTWPGKNESLRPALLISHLDVVPVPDASLKVS